MNCNILVAILGFNWILKIYMLLFNFRFRIVCYGTTVVGCMGGNGFELNAVFMMLLMV